jgi:hypothetical protein
VNVGAVLSDRIASLWPEIGPLLRPAIKRGGTHAEGDVLRAIQSGMARLYVEHDEGVIAAAVAEIVTYPLMRVVRVWLAGAKPGARVDWDEFQRQIEDWGRFEGCAEARIEGRRGWARRLSGTRCAEHILRKTL